MDWQKYRLWIGLGVLVVLIGGVVYAYTSEKEADRPTETSEQIDALLPEIDKSAIEELEIRRPDEEPIRLAKRDGTWRVVAPVDAPADSGIVDTALTKIAELDVTRVAATNDANHARLEVSPDKGIRVIARGGGETLIDFWVGAYQSLNTMIRVEGQDQVLAVKDSIKFAFNKPVDDWRDKKIVAETVRDIVSISFQNPNGAWSFVRGEGDAWSQAAGEAPIERFSSAKIQSIASTLANARATSFAAPDVTIESAGLAEGTASKVTLRLRAGGVQASEDAAMDEAAMDETAMDETAMDEAAMDEAAMDDVAAESPPDVPADEPQPTEPQQDGTTAIVLYVSATGPEDSRFYLRREGDDTIYVVMPHVADKVRVNVEAFQDAPPAAPEEGGEDAPPEDPHGDHSMDGAPTPMISEEELQRIIQQATMM
jgi:hypothetical protein